MTTPTRVKNAIFVAATQQHVGKTSTCLGLIQGLLHDNDAIKHIGYIKPVGQHTVTAQEHGRNVRVDKDVRVAKEIFGLDHCHYNDMSPVVIPQGYTKDFLDGKIGQLNSQMTSIRRSFETISRNNDFTVVEGTGHTGVGSIVGVNNAAVAASLGVDMVTSSSDACHLWFYFLEWVGVCVSD